MDFNELYELERQARKEGNVEALKDIFLRMVQLCGDDREVISLIRVLASRRGQDRNSIKWLIKEVYKKEEEFARSILSEVVEGKMYLEAERIAITLDLKEKYEAQGDIKKALEIILDVPVETFTMIPEMTIVKYQLEQFRLCVEVQDWVRADITMKKIRKKYFVENEAIEDELLFYKYIVDLYLGQEKFFEASSTYLKLNEIADNKESTILASFFGILCSCEGEKKDVRIQKRELLTKLANDKNNEEGMRLFLDRFLSSLVIEKQAVGSIMSIVNRYKNVDNYLPFVLRAVDEHNFFIVEKFYATVSISTCSKLLDVDSEDLINRISFMVNNGLSTAKINQKEGLVVFGDKKWNSDVGDVLNKLIKVDHMIHKENLKKIIRNE
ncbi:26S proteasome non-ATPase regulatory subunit 12 [Nosema granulosis]|uniref:26S proteasome non-ATPase regulatory subunit 12 n=1 Tax=Nosema granulosis TaxID=83296 RepID=A0A9P6L0I9_9MICR|nr:26S proteasome non-ATPase regulatory subunit 12 [Nosema granulosis]